MEFSFDVTKILRKPISIVSGADLPKAQRSLENLYFVIDELGIASAKAQGLKVPVTSGMKMKQNQEQRLYIMRESIAANGSSSKNPNEISVRELEQTACDTTITNNQANLFKDIHREIPTKSHHVVVGMIKVGPKKLFLVDEYGRNIEINMLCVLDFYVSEALQRKGIVSFAVELEPKIDLNLGPFDAKLGYGRRLFDFMLSIENVAPHILAYDKPSPKCLSFLSRHFNLVEHVPQPNNFVVFKEFGLGMLALDSKGRPKSPIPASSRAFKKASKRSASPSRAEGLSKMFNHFTRAAEFLNSQDSRTTRPETHDNGINIAQASEGIGSLLEQSNVVKSQHEAEHAVMRSAALPSAIPEEEPAFVDSQNQEKENKTTELVSENPTPMHHPQPVLPPPRQMAGRFDAHPPATTKSPFYEKYGRFCAMQSQPQNQAKPSGLLPSVNVPLQALNSHVDTVFPQASKLPTEFKDKVHDTTSEAVSQLWPSTTGTMAATRVAVLSGTKTIQMLEMAEQERKARIRILMGNVGTEKPLSPALETYKTSPTGKNHNLTPPDLEGLR